MISLREEPILVCYYGVKRGQKYYNIFIMSRYPNDEFNNNSAINDRDPLKNEFFQNKNVEFSSQRDNSIPKDEFTAKDNSSLHASNNENINQLTEKVVESSSQAVTVSSSATAGSIAATSSSVIAAAATVAVVAIGTVTGISTVLHNYDYRFNVFSVSANELTYELVITDNNQNEEEMLSYEDLEQEKDKEVEQPFTLRVYNATYDYSHSLYLGRNENTFTGLTLGQSYNIVLSESRYGGKTLFEESFTTMETTVFRSFSIPGTANFVDQTFDVELNYVDATNSFSDFSLYLEDVEFPEELYITYDLEEKSGKQILNAVTENDEYLDLRRTYNYKFSYRNNGETVDFSEGQVSFTDTSGAVTTFTSFTIDSNVDFEGDSFNAQLDYDDPLNNYYSFYLNMTPVSGSYISSDFSFYLDNTTEVQAVYVDGYGFDFNTDYNYSLMVYTYNGEETLATGTVSFNDIYNRQSYFDKFIFDKTANFMTGEVNFQLEYFDELNYFDNFVVTFTNKDENLEVPIELRKTTEPQPKPAMEYGLSFEYNYTYKLTAEYKGTVVTLVEDLNTFLFEDNFDGESTVHGLMFIGGEAKYSNRSFDVVLDFADDYDCLDQYVLTLYDEENNSSIDISLDETTEEQTVFANEIDTDSGGGDTVYKVDIVSHHITYNVTYRKDNGGTYETISLFDEPQSVKFSNSEFLSFEYTGALFRPTGETNYSMGMKFNYIDENENAYSDWHVVYYDSNDQTVCETWLTNDDHAYEWNYYSIISFGDDSLVDALIGNYCTISVEVNIYDETTGISSNGIEVYRFENEILVRLEDADPQIYGINLDHYFTYGIYELSARALVFKGSPDMFADVQLVIETRDANKYTYDIDVTNESFSIFLDQPVEDNFDGDDFESQVSGTTVTIRIKYRYYIASDVGTGTGSGSSDPQYELSDELIEIICYNDFAFEIGH